MVKLDHLSIPVSDWRRTRDWYVEHLGFRIEFEAPAGGREGLGVVALQDDAGLTLFGEQLRGAIQTGQASYTIQVENVDDLHQRLVSAGLGFKAAPSKLFWGYGAVLEDPDGHVLHLYDARTMAEKG
jgi:catechol 2,3-dioxygenase-like lactoylglutathione lyase family enzyme